MKKIFFSIGLSLLCIALYAQEQSTLMLSNGLKFLGTPYIAHTLDVNSQESLVINCDEVDCTTFVEYALAMTLAAENVNTINENDFIAWVQKIRYRDGKIDGYASRLHYLSDWIQNGVCQGFLTDVTYKQSPHMLRKEINYMSTHPNLYKQLLRSAQDMNKIKAIEKNLSEKEIHYLPKDKLPINGLPWIQNGDILAITTNTPGLDICHVGIAFYVQGKLCLLHASSSEKKVLVSCIALSHMMKSNEKWTGLRVIRVKKAGKTEH